MSRVLPTFLILGAARSGTTALVEGLTTHPGVFVTVPKEPHYFALHARDADFTGPGDAHTINRVAVTTEEAYLDLYPAAGHGFQALGEASVSSLYYHRQSIPEIRRLCPDAKLVVLLREPVQRAFSAYSYLRARGFETHERFLDAVADEDRRVIEGWHHLWHLTRMSRYSESLIAYQDAFGHDRVGVWFYDDIESAYDQTVGEILRFIGTTSEAREGQGVQRVNVSGAPRSRLVQCGIKLLTRNDLARRSVKRMTSYRTREAVRRALLRKVEVDVQAHRQLAPLFAEDLAALRDLVPHERAPAWLRSAT